MAKAAFEYKVHRCDSDAVMALIAEDAKDGWEVVCVYPHSVQGEGTMHLLVTSVKIVFRRPVK